MVLKLTQSLTLVTLLLSATGCQTVSMSAKTGTDAVSAEGGTCARYKNERGSCDDQVGCGWDHARGTCASR